jgi:hypothetical protein
MVTSYAGMDGTDVARHLIGKPIRRLFKNLGYFNGDVTGFDAVRKRFTIHYHDGDEEEMGFNKLVQCLQKEEAILVKEWLRAEENGKRSQEPMCMEKERKTSKPDESEHAEREVEDDKDVAGFTGCGGRGRQESARVRARLCYDGPTLESCDGHLPQTFELDPDVKRTVDVGREVVEGLVLDSPSQSLMISRLHCRLSYCSASKVVCSIL